MAYSENLAERIRHLIALRNLPSEEKKMMGGLCFMVNGKMCCGIVKDELMVRVIEEKYEAALTRHGCRVMDFTGRPMKGFLFVGEEGFSTEKELDDWLALGVEFVFAEKPPKRKKK